MGIHVFPTTSDVRQVAGYSPNRSRSLIPRCEILAHSAGNFTTDATREELFITANVEFPVCARLLSAHCRIQFSSGSNFTAFDHPGNFEIINILDGGDIGGNRAYLLTEFNQVTTNTRAGDSIVWQAVPTNEIYRPSVTGVPNLPIQFRWVIRSDDNGVLAGEVLTIVARFHVLGYDREQVENKQFITAVPVILT